MQCVQVEVPPRQVGESLARPLLIEAAIGVADEGRDVYRAVAGEAGVVCVAREGWGSAAQTGCDGDYGGEFAEGGVHFISPVEKGSGLGVLIAAA